jgi:hypothetical protein
VSDAALIGSPDESNNGRVIRGERNDDYEQRKKRDQAAAWATSPFLASDAAQ